jgi:hypothetical protein
MAKEEKKDDDAAPQAFITVIFEGPGSSRIVSLRTGEVSLNQVALAARELQGIADFEQWWSAYSARMAQMEQEAQKRMEEEMVRKAIMQGGGLKPN